MCPLNSDAVWLGVQLRWLWHLHHALVHTEYYKTPSLTWCPSACILPQLTLTAQCLLSYCFHLPSVFLPIHSLSIHFRTVSCPEIGFSLWVKLEILSFRGRVKLICTDGYSHLSLLYYFRFRFQFFEISSSGFLSLEIPILWILACPLSSLHLFFSLFL